MDYVIGAKPGDHKYLFEWINDLPGETYQQVDDDGTIHDFTCFSNVPLNDANHDYRVNVLEYCQTNKKGKILKFSWVTKIKITKDNVYKIMRAGRSRWRIESVPQAHKLAA